LSNDRSFLGHPRGLAYLAFSEAWERFSYYSMQALLVLYMARQLLLPGHVEHIAGFNGFRAALEFVYGRSLSTLGLSSAIFGAYSGLVYLAPIVGGVVADRLLGRTRTIVLGALLMVAGHFLLAFEVSFLIALACLLVGVGFFKGNMASRVGELYSPGDPRRADAFQVYNLCINVAVIMAPLTAGTLGERVGWEYGFGLAGVGMLISLVIYLSGGRWLPVDPGATRVQRGPERPLASDERRAILVLILILPVLALGALGNQQINNVYMLWVPEHVDLVFFGHAMPNSWLVLIDAVVSLPCLLLVMAFWRAWSRHFPQPSDPVKISIGIATSALGVLALVAAAAISTGGHKAGIGWVFAFELFNSLGFANLFPVGLALFSRAAPKPLAGTLIGVYYLHLFLANNLVGWLGGLVERLSGVQFWLLHATLSGAAALAMLIIARVFGHLLIPPATGQ
jgi:POT family proton-dependent oligopeptide transporter